jgi:hypothetical protein
VTLASGTRVKLEMPPRRCGYPAVTTVGPHNGSTYPLLCTGCGAPRAQVSNSTAATIGKSPTCSVRRKLSLCGAVNTKRFAQTRE